MYVCIYAFAFFQLEYAYTHIYYIAQMQCIFLAPNMERLEPGLPQQAGGEMAKVAALHGAVGGVSLFDASRREENRHERGQENQEHEISSAQKHLHYRQVDGWMDGCVD